MEYEQLRHLKRRFTHKLKLIDSEWRDHWKEVSEYIAPRRGRFLDREGRAAEGGKKRRKILNGTAGDAFSVAVSGIKGGLTPRSLPWFTLTLEDTEMAKWKPAKMWLSEVERRMYAVFAKSNFYAATNEIYGEQFLFGTGPVEILENPETHCWLVPWSVGEYALATDDLGRVDSAFRWYWMSVRSMAQKWGEENLRPETRELLRNRPDHHMEVVRAIFPRSDYDPRKRDALNMPWGTVYWEKGMADNEYIVEGGFRTRPAMFPRWESIGEDAYGNDCPGFKVLPDVKSLQLMESDKMRLVEMAANPPYNLPAKFKDRFSLAPGAKNRVGTDQQVKPSIEPNLQIGELRAEIRDVEQRIRTSMFYDLFLMLANNPDGQMTAYEVAKRYEEKLQVLGPMVESQQSDFLDPCVDRVFDIMLTRGLIPPPPEDLEGEDLKVEYTSILSQAMKSAGVTAIEQHMGFVGQIAQFDPTVLDTVNTDEMAYEHGNIKHVNPNIMRSREEVKARREQRQQMQEQQAQLESAQAAASVAKDLKQAQIEE